MELIITFAVPNVPWRFQPMNLLFQLRSLKRKHRAVLPEEMALVPVAKMHTYLPPVRELLFSRRFWKTKQKQQKKTPHAAEGTLIAKAALNMKKNCWLRKQNCAS